MEDRHTAGLYLEMTDQPVEAYVAERVPEVLALPGVDRATWWRNVERDRDDLPRVLPEFDHLGVYEVDDAFTAPPTPAGVTGHHFRRYRRPGQGIAHRPADDRPLARADLAEGARRRRRSCATGPTSCTSATSPRSRCPATR